MCKCRISFYLFFYFTPIDQKSTGTKYIIGDAITICDVAVVRTGLVTARKKKIGRPIKIL